ncbi:MAG: hypothetical protein ABR530_04930 [Pyrinomonadaceae bacterium]
MNEEYLWNKTGSDPEIEHLEAVLSVLRDESSRVPVLQAANVLAFPNRSFFSRSRLVLAIAASVALVVAPGIWSLVVINVTEAELGANGPVQQQTASMPTQEEIPVEGVTSDLREKDIDTVKPSLRRHITRRAAIKSHSKVPNRLIAKKNSPKLTDEERHAYNQLLLALSITSSKLQIVRDMVGNAESPQTKNDR